MDVSEILENKDLPRVFSDANLARFLEENENKNTKKETQCDLMVFGEYLA